MDTNKNIYKSIKWNVFCGDRCNAITGFLQIIFKFKKNRK